MLVLNRLGHQNASVDDHYNVRQALNNIYSSFGDICSVESKKKSLSKFGRTTGTDANERCVVAQFQGDEIEETFTTSNSIDRVVSSDDGDNQTLVYEGHYFDGSNNFIFFSDEVTLTGNTPATLPTVGCRINRAYIKKGTFASPSTDIAGNVAFYDSTVATSAPSGIPNDSTATKLYLPGRNQSEKCATSISSTDYWILSGVRCSLVTKTGSPVAEFDVEYREIGGVWRPLGLEVTLASAVQKTELIQFDPFIVIPKNSDVQMIADCDTNGTIVSGRIFGYLAEVIQ